MKLTVKFSAIILIITLLLSSFAIATYASDNVIIDTGGGGGFIDEVFGGDLELEILKPIRFWEQEGTAGFMSIVFYIYLLLNPILLIAFLFVVGIGVAKWMTSGGQDGKIESAQKWLKNGVTGFAAVIITFAAASSITYFLGVGSIFDLGQNLANCDGKPLYQYKVDQYDNADEQVDCTCESFGWSCK